MTILWIVLAVVLVGAFIFWRLLATAVRWGQEYTELRDHGVVTTGRVLRKVVESSRHGAGSRYLRYEYVDQFGKTHLRKKMLVTDQAWNTLEEGGPIAIVYSERNPKVNAPQYLVESLANTEPPQKLKDRL